MTHKLTATFLVAAAVMTNVAFIALGAIFNYPDVLKEPAGDVLAAFRDSQVVVSGLFAVMAASAALMAPIAVGVGRLPTRSSMRVAVPVGIAAAAVQVIGLLRWPLLVPGYAAKVTSGDPIVAATAEESFVTAHHIFGTIVGETLGYILTAAWTLLVLAAVGRRIAGRWFSAAGGVSAMLILAGVLSPLDLPLVDMANFAGYVVWSVWLVAFAALLIRWPDNPNPTHTESAMSDARS